jgi:molybdenum cofactor cytidylyltransferase
VSLGAQLGLGARELVAIVGAGGKSTMLLGLGGELSGAGSSVVMTTTTKMGADQLPKWAAACRTIGELMAAVDLGRPVFLFGDVDSSKIVGVSAAVVDQVFAQSGVDYVLAEADGAAGRFLKAPAGHEPVIPAGTTAVVVVVGLRAVGGRIADVAHRPERVAALLGCGIDHVLEPLDLATVIAHPQGGMWRIPEAARVVVALTGGDELEASEIQVALGAEPRIERVVAVGHYGS